MNKDKERMFTIRQAQITDAEALTAIYNEYIRHTTITFETEEITIAENTRRMVDIISCPHNRERYKLVQCGLNTPSIIMVE